MPQSIEDTKAFEAGIGAPTLTVVHFFADFAEQCKQVDDVLDVLAKQSDYSNAQFLKCPAEDLSEISLKYKIEAVPTILLFRSGDLVDRVEGADVSKITEKIKANCNAGDGGVPTNTKAIPLEERLKALVNKSTVMLFMKGNRSEPRCGFSRTIIQILNDTGCSYETFDILSDEEIRQGLKTFSDWPTYPQLYVKGELIGGLDIVKEMVASGEFAEALQA